MLTVEDGGRELLDLGGPSATPTRSVVDLRPSWRTGDRWSVVVFTRNMAAFEERWLGPFHWDFEARREVEFDGKRALEISVRRQGEEGEAPGLYYVDPAGGRMVGARIVRKEGGRLRRLYIKIEGSESLVGMTLPVPFDFPTRPMTAETTSSPFEFTTPLSKRLRSEFAGSSYLRAGRYHHVSFEGTDGKRVDQRWGADRLWPATSFTNTRRIYRVR